MPQGDETFAIRGVALMPLGFKANCSVHVMSHVEVFEKHNLCIIINILLVGVCVKSTDLW